MSHPETFSSLSRPKRWKRILAIAWPLIVANSFWNLQLTIDRIFLGNYSTEALGAAMAVMGIFWVPMALLQQTAAYVATFVAQYLGAQRPEEIGGAFWNSIHLSIVGGLAMLGLIPLAPLIFAGFDHPPSVQLLEVEYFIAICTSALPTALVAAASGFYTGLGRTKIIMVINCVGFLANVFFDYLLIFGHWGLPAMGIRGAGYATALANWAAAAVGLYLVLRDKEAPLYRLASSWRYNGATMARFLRFGLPSGLQWALEGLAFTVFLLFVGRMANGSAALAASSIVVTVMMLSILPTLGIAQAVAVLVGQHLGDKNPKEAEVVTWSGLQVAEMYILSMGLTFLAFPQFYLSWFHNPSDPTLWGQVSTMVPYLLMFVALFTSFDSMNLVFSFALKGAGDTRFVSLVALMLPWPLMVFPTWMMKDWTGAVYWAWGAASLFGITQAFVFLARFRQGRWQTMSVIN